MKRALAVAGFTLSLCGCPAGGGGGGSGGGGGGGLTFNKGFLYVRKDDRNLYVSDMSDYTQVSALTASSNVHAPSMSKDGKLALFAIQAPSGSEIDSVPTGGGNVSAVISTATQTGISNLREPVLSPDGSKVVFSYDSGAGTTLGVSNADGTGFAALGAGGQSFSSPSFYPDGTAVLAAGGSFGSGMMQLQKIDLASGQATGVALGLGAEAMSIANRAVISPDGTQAAFDGRISTNVSRIFVINLATGAVTRLTDYPADENANDTFPCWQGNQTVAFSSDTGGNDQVYTLASTALMTTGTLVLPSAIEPWFGPN